MKKLMTAVAIAAVAMMGAMQVANADALDDIKKSGKIRIAVDLGVPPYGMTDDKMQPTGSDIETAKLLAKGPEKCAEKFGEEAIEAIIEAVKGDRAKLTAEAADVLYHLLVMLAARDVTLADVAAELERREGVSGIAEKAAR